MNTAPKLGCLLIITTVLRVVLRTALTVEHFRRELGVLAEIDEVGRDRVLRRQPFEIGKDLLQTREIDAAEEGGGRLAVRRARWV